MTFRSLIGTALLLSGVGLGSALAATDADLRLLPERPVGLAAAAPAEAAPVRVAGRDHDDDDDEDDRRSGHRKHHDDDDDDDDDDRGGRQAMPMNPNAPVPDNGLFAGKSRPTVQVQ